MADLGLLQGLTEGLNSGINSYYSAQDRQQKKLETNEERALKKKQYALDLLKSGYEEAPDGVFRVSPITAEREHQKKVEDIAAKKGERIAKQNDEFGMKGYLPKRDEGGTVVGLSRLPGYIDPEEQKRKRDPFKALPEDQQIAAKGLIEQNVKRDKGLTDVDAALGQLEDPKIPDDQKVVIGQLLLKTLNDPNASDAIGAEEVNRIGAYLQNFSLTRAGSTFGRDLKRFTAQVRNRRNQIATGRNATESDIAKRIGRAPSEPVALRTEPGAKSGGYMPEAQAASGQDMAALDWARQNPNDPRAQKILQLNGAR